MSGHNKWSKVKRIKEVIDKKKGAIYSKYLKEITILAKNGSDPNHNARLRKAIEDAKAQNVPKDNIERAVKKGAGELNDGAQLEELIYEGIGPNGVAILVDCVTDNRLRTQPEIRKIFEKYGGTIAEKGSVSWRFENKGQILIGKDQAAEDRVMTIALEVGAEDFIISEEGYEVITTPSHFERVYEAFKKENISMALAEIATLPQNKISIEEESAGKLQKLMEALEDHDDVQRVSSNADIF